MAEGNEGNPLRFLWAEEMAETSCALDRNRSPAARPSGLPFCSLFRHYFYGHARYRHTPPTVLPFFLHAAVFYILLKIACSASCPAFFWHSHLTVLHSSGILCSICKIRICHAHLGKP